MHISVTSLEKAEASPSIHGVHLRLTDSERSTVGMLLDAHEFARLSAAVKEAEVLLARQEVKS